MDKRDEDALPVGEAKVRAVQAMFDRIAPRYDLVNRVMTFGLDVRWRRRAVRSLGLARRSVVLDLASGTGDLCCELREAGLTSFGFDVSWGMLTAARPCGPMVQADALRLPVASGVADGATCGFALRNVVDLRSLFNEAARVLRTGGRFAALEVSAPSSALPRAVHHVYFHRVVPAIGGFLSDRDAYRYLPRSTAYLPETPDLLALVESSGFGDVRSDRLGRGAAQVITGTRR